MVFVGKYEWLLKQDVAEPDIFDLDTVEPVGAIPIAFIISPVYRLPTYMEWLMEQSMKQHLIDVYEWRFDEMYDQHDHNGLNTMEANE